MFNSSTRWLTQNFENSGENTSKSRFLVEKMFKKFWSKKWRFWRGQNRGRVLKIRWSVCIFNRSTRWCKIFLYYIGLNPLKKSTFGPIVDFLKFLDLKSHFRGVFEGLFWKIDRFSWIKSSDLQSVCFRFWKTQVTWHLGPICPGSKIIVSNNR